MAGSRQEAFQKLRPPCVELSSVGLKFRANLVTSQDVIRTLEPVHSVLTELDRKNCLDEKLAEYAFFPLTHIFNQTQQASVRCLELAVRCLQILIEKGWRQKLSSQMGKQLLILLTMLAGGAPGQSQTSQNVIPQSEELSIAAFDCIAALCRLIQGQDATTTIFNEIGSATVVDQAVYILLEAIVDGPADGVQLSSARALQAIHSRITDRVVLASLMPRTVSALTKALRSTSQSRRSYQLLCCCLKILTEDLRAVLNDAAVSATKNTASKSKKATGSDAMALDESWLKATVSQVKLALANVVPLRNHDRREVRHALMHLCVMIMEECQNSLEDSLPMAVETLVVLSHSDDSHSRNDTYTTFRHIISSSEPATNILKSSLHSWIVALPRVMQSSDDSAKQRAIKQISTAFQILSEVQPKNDIIDETMTTSLCDSVSSAIRSSANAPQPLDTPVSSGMEVETLNDNAESAYFAPVLMEHGNQKDTLKELRLMIAKLNNTDSNLEIPRSMLNRFYRHSGDACIAPFWLALSFLKSTAHDATPFDDIIDPGAFAVSPSKASLIEELYSISLPVLTELQTANPEDWRLPALALEAVALQAQQLGESFRPELLDTLYPTLQLMGSSNPGLKNHAMTCLNLMSNACGYPNASTMLIENVDYLVNAVALKLNTFDISPQAPQVLLMMVRLCGARLIPYLDDLVGSIFAVLDSFHGYPKLVELLFEVLGTVVDEGAKRPAMLAIIDNGEDKPVEHRKRRYAATSVPDLAKEFKDRREKRARTDTFKDEHIGEEIPSHPKQPWSSHHEGVEMPDDDADQETDSEADPTAQQKEDEEAEKSPTKSHSLLLSIIKSIPPHLSSPSPFLRRSLLSILTRGLPILARDENSFLPLVNDIWPSVSARITVSPEHPSHTSSSLSSSLSSPDPAPINVDETGVQEETFVTVASCAAIEAMCRGAGDFMSSRVEQDFLRWKKLYLRSWDRVRHDSEKAAERQQLHLQQRQQQRHQGTSRVVSQMELLHLDPESSSMAKSQNPLVQPPSPGFTPTPPPPPPSTSKAFTPHHALFKALTSLFTTLISHVRLPADIADDITECLGSWISFYYPDHYFSSAWREEAETDTTVTAASDTGAGSRATRMDDIDEAVQAMDTWNPDLTWFIFAQGRARGRGRDTNRSEVSDMRRRMDERVVKEVTGEQPLRFADLVVF